MAPLDQDLPNEKHMGFLDHLEELRSRLFKSVLAIFITSTILFVKKDWVFDMILFGPRNPNFISFRMWCKLSEFIGAGDQLCGNWRGTKRCLFPHCHFGNGPVDARRD